MLLRNLHFALAHRHRLRHQQWLTAYTLFRIPGSFKALVGNALMGRVHIHQHQPLGILRQNVNTLELRQCVTQGGHLLC